MHKKFPRVNAHHDHNTVGLVLSHELCKASLSLGF